MIVVLYWNVVGEISLDKCRKEKKSKGGWGSDLQSTIYMTQDHVAGMLAASSSVSKHRASW